MAGEEDKTDSAKTVESDGAQPASAENTVEEGKTSDNSGSDHSTADEQAADDKKHGPTRPQGLRISVSVRSLVVATLIVVLLAVAGAMTWLYFGEKSKVDAQARQAADDSHAERIALDYAVDAARIDYKDLDAWKKNLIKGTTPELTDKLNSAGNSMEQILSPLQWNSTATPLAAKVRSNANGIYVVDAFVGVETKTIQAPDGLQSTATYSVTMDGNHNWQISEVGGIGAVVGQK